MFSFLRRFFGKRSADVKFGFEERRYSLGIIVLVFFLASFLMMLGEFALSDLGEGVPRPPYPYYGELTEERQARLFEEQVLRPLWERRANLERQIDATRGEYDSSLLEELTDEEERLYGEQGDVRARYEDMQREFAEVQIAVIAKEEEHHALMSAAEAARKVAYREYEQIMRWRQLRVFAWEALFWIPFFAISIAWYTRAKRRESLWEPVSLSTLIAASLLALQSICVLLWSWLPREFLEWLWRILRATLFTRVVGYDLLVAGAIFLFGGLIVFVHRRVTDPVRFGKRRIRHELCPTCSYPLRLSLKYCGGCGSGLTVACSSCGNEGFRWQAGCVHCGAVSPTPPSAA